MEGDRLNRLAVDLRIIWKFDLLRPDCYFSVRLKAGGKGHIGFTSPILKSRRVLKEGEIENINQLLKSARPPVVLDSFYEGVVHMIDPDIPCEIIVSTEDWRLAFRWSTGKEEFNRDNLNSMADIGRYLQEILPVESMGFTYPKYF